MYVDKLNDIVNKYKNTYHRTIKIKADVKNNTYINFGEESNTKDPKLKVGDHVGISKYKNIFAKRYMLQIGLKKCLWLKKLKMLFHGHMLLSILMVNKLLELFLKINYKSKSKRNLIKRSS